MNTIKIVITFQQIKHKSFIYKLIETDFVFEYKCLTPLTKDSKYLPFVSFGQQLVRPSLRKPNCLPNIVIPKPLVQSCQQISDYSDLIIALFTRKPLKGL